MPAQQPFTRLCQELATRRPLAWVDLHVHSTASDGVYTPAQVVELARRSGLPALALTDHDTLAGIPAARAVAGDRLEVIAGVEITAEFEGKEQHLLAYFVPLNDVPLNRALERLQASRRERFQEMVVRLRARGVEFKVPDDILAHTTLGRRHLAELLVKARKADSVRQAFQRYLHDFHPANVPKQRLPVFEAIELVRQAGGVTSWAHPAADVCTPRTLARWKEAGLGAIEVEFPAQRPSRSREMRQWARTLGLAVTGGSDNHGPDPLARAIGSRGVTTEELAALRQLAHP